MVYAGVVRGNVIELEAPLPFREGQPVSVSLEPLPVEDEPPPGSPAAILKAMREPPHLTAADVDALERSIEEGKLPVRHEGIFDDEG